MKQSKDYYKILGIEKNATEDEIKKAFRKQAVKWHPDKWANSSEEEKKKAEEMFKDIAEANEILSDPNKRQRYDNGTLDFEESGFNVDPFEVFNRMRTEGFGGFNFGGFGFGNRGPRKGDNVYVTVHLTPEEAYSGGKRTISVPRHKTCEHCNGTGSDDGLSHPCRRCNGTGFVMHSEQRGNMLFTQQTPCPSCGGSGKEPTTPCKECHGTGIKEEVEKMEVTLPMGLSSKFTIGIDGKGEPSVNGGPNGDLIIVIEVIQDENSYFIIDGNRNVIHVENIPFNLALLGVEKEVKCIDGKKVKIKIPELTKDGHSLRLKGKGLPDPNNTQTRGDYYVVINYEFPKKLNKKQKEMLKNFNNE
jgi:molecular chaperone DnaJ